MLNYKVFVKVSDKHSDVMNTLKISLHEKKYGYISWATSKVIAQIMS